MRILQILPLLLMLALFLSNISPITSQIPSSLEGSGFSSFNNGVLAIVGPEGLLITINSCINALKVNLSKHFNPIEVLTVNRTIFVAGSYMGEPAIVQLTLKGCTLPKTAHIITLSGLKGKVFHLVWNGREVYGVGYVESLGRFEGILITLPLNRINSTLYATAYSISWSMLKTMVNQSIYFRDVIPVATTTLILGGISYNGRYYPLIVNGSQGLAYIQFINTMGSYWVKGFITCDGRSSTFLVSKDHELYIANASSNNLTLLKIMEKVKNAWVIHGYDVAWLALAELDNNTFIIIGSEGTCMIEESRYVIFVDPYEVLAGTSLPLRKVRLECSGSIKPLDINVVKPVRVVLKMAKLRESVIFMNVSGRTWEIYPPTSSQGSVIRSLPNNLNASEAGGYVRSKVFRVNQVMLLTGLALVTASLIAEWKLKRG